MKQIKHQIKCIIGYENALQKFKEEFEIATKEKVDQLEFITTMESQPPNQSNQTIN